jgi:hypothetical protein
MEQLGSRWPDFSRNLTFEYFSKNYSENSSFIKTGQELPVLWCMRVACRTTKATNTRTQYIILISFPLEHWLHERA